MGKNKNNCKIQIFAKSSGSEANNKPHNFSLKYNIQLNITFDSIEIDFHAVDEKNIDKIFYKPAIQIALDKSFLLYTLICNKPFKQDDAKKFKVILNGKETKVDDVFPVYTMLEGVNNLHFSDKALNSLAAIKKSDNDSRYPALTNFLLSKTKKYESERFMFLWMSMNGLYSKYRKFMNISYTDEATDISNFARFKGFNGVNFSREEKNAVFNWIKEYLYVLILENENISFSKDSENENIRQTISDYVFSKTGKREDGYCYLLFHFCYSMRCKYFHSEKSLPIYELRQDSNWKLLKHLNDMLSDFLQEELSRVFEDDYIKKTDSASSISSSL